MFRFSQTHQQENWSDSRLLLTHVCMLIKKISVEIMATRRLNAGKTLLAIKIMKRLEEKINSDQAPLTE